MLVRIAGTDCQRIRREDENARFQGRTHRKGIPRQQENRKEEIIMASEKWQTKAGQNPKGGLNAAGRASYNKAHGGHLKAPAPNPKTKAESGRKASFCARMKGLKSKLTSAKTAKDPDSRVNKALRAWKCH